MADGKKSSGNIIIPTLNIDDSLAPLAEKIYSATKGAEKVNILDPFSGFFRLNKLSKQKGAIAEEYEIQLKECYDLLKAPVEGPGMAMAFAQSWSTAKGLAAITKLQETWRNLDALVDRKYAYSVAIFSLYIAVASLVLTVLSLI